MLELTRREKILIAAILAAFLIGAGYKYYRNQIAIAAAKQAMTEHHAINRIQ